MINSLNVILWGKKAGTLIANPKGYRSQICFYFDPEFIKEGLDIAPLRASIKGIPAQRGLPIYPEEEKIFGGLPSFIADSMPDDWGNTIFNEWARTHNIRQKDISPLDRLAYIGSRGMGALEFVPSINPPETDGAFRVEIAQLSEFANIALRSAKDFHAQLSPGLAIESLFKVGTSAGGRRPKALVNPNPVSGECYSGQVAPPSPGFTPMIIKFDEGGSLPMTRIEYSYYLMTKHAGIKMMPSRLIEIEGKCHFLTERFDRHGAEKMHVQTLAAMNPFASSYEDLFEVAIRLNLTADELQHIYRQMVMNVMAANVDDHSKNFSFMMDKAGHWSLAPVYDFTFTFDVAAPYYVNRHCMTINGANQDIRREDMLAVAERFNIKAADSIINRTQTILDNYPEYAQQAGILPKHIAQIMQVISASKM